MISIIAAIGQNRELGINGRIPWFIKGEQIRFQQITFGHPVIMGRKTYQSIKPKYRPLAGRLNIVVSRQKDWTTPGCEVCCSLTKAIKLAQTKDKKEIFIAGGGEIYRQAIGLADKLYLTVVQAEFTADTFFPDYSRFNKVVAKQSGQNDQYQYLFLELERSK